MLRAARHQVFEIAGERGRKKIAGKPWRDGTCRRGMVSNDDGFAIEWLLKFSGQPLPTDLMQK
jgi:hypothetical protein